MKNEIYKIHDHFIRSAMNHKEVSKEFFEHNLSAHIRELVDMDSIEQKKESFVDEKLHEQVTDMLFSTKIKDKPGYIYVLVEHQSTAEKLMSWRLHCYITAIMDNHLKNSVKKELPIVIPIVFYNGQNKYNYSTNIFDLFADRELAEKMLFKPFHLVDLNQISDRELNQFLFYGTIARVMKHARNFGLSNLLDELFEILFFWQKNGYNQISNLVINYMFHSGDTVEKNEFLNTLNKKAKKSGGEVMTLAQALINDGKKEGRRTEKLAIAKKLKQKKVATSIIKMASGLSAKEIEKL